MEFLTAKHREMRARLREIKYVLEYPGNQSKLSDPIIRLINELDDHKLGKKFKKVNKQIPMHVSAEEIDKEEAKHYAILKEIELVLKMKKMLTDSEPNVSLSKKQVKPI